MLRVWCWTLPRLVLDLLRLFLAVTVMTPGFIRFAWYYWIVAQYETVTYATTSCRQRMDVYPPPVSSSTIMAAAAATATAAATAGSNHHKKQLDDDSNKGTTPVVVFVAGGAWMIGYKLWGALLARSLLKAGNVCVVMMDYRNYPWGCVPDQVQDLQLALNWTKQHIHKYGGDASQIVLVGESAGGHLATLFLLQKAFCSMATTTTTTTAADEASAATFTKNKNETTAATTTTTTNTFELADCKGLVTIAAPLDLSLMMNSCAKHGLDREGLYRIFGVNSQSGLDRLDPLQLVTKAHFHHHRRRRRNGQPEETSSSLFQQLPPMLICQGTRDGTVPVESAKSFTTALQEQLLQQENKTKHMSSSSSRASVELRIYTGWNHTRANVEGPMEGDLTFHRDVWEAVQKWNKHDDVLQRNNQDDDSTNVWEELGRLCPTVLVKLGSWFMPV